MLPKDEEDFSTLQPTDLRPDSPASEAARKPESAKPRPVPVEPPSVSILSGEPLGDLCSKIAFSERARQAVPFHRAPLQLFDNLIREDLFEDAARLLAHTLPQREAVGWAYLCAKQAHAHEAALPIETALTVVSDWLLRPEEEFRITAQKAADDAGLATPAGRACAAAFLTGPEDDLPPPLLKPGQNYAAVGVTAAVLCAARWGDEEKTVERLGRFLAEGRKVAGGDRPWESGT